MACIQETRLTETELAALTRACQRNGFKHFHLKGNKGVDGRAQGGVSILVDKRLVTGPNFSELGQDALLLGIWVEDWFIATHYAPPLGSRTSNDPQVEACSLIESICIKSGCNQTGNWISLGTPSSLII